MDRKPNNNFNQDKNKIKLIDYLKENKNVILDDIIYIYIKLKNKKIIELIIYIFLFLPIIWLLINLFILFIIINYCSIIKEFLEKCLLKYFYKKKYVKPIKCVIKKSNNKNEFFIFFQTLYKDTSYYISFYYFYMYLKIIKEITSKKKNPIKIYNIILIFLRILVRLLIFFIFNYSVLILKITIDILDIIKKCFKENVDSYKTLLQIIMVDILSKYYTDWYLKVKKKRIKFLKNKIKLNMKPGGKKIKQAVEYALFQIKIKEKDADKLKDALEKLSQHTDLRYSQLETSRQENEKEIIIKEKKPHTSGIINISDDSKILIRATTSNKVQIENAKPMETHTPSKGIINPFKIEKKTDIIESKLKDIKNIYNPTLIQNIKKNPQYIDYYKLAFINSLENKTYIWDGGLHQDPKYINLIEKIEKDPILKKDVELKKCLDIISETYHNNIKDFKFKTNNQTFNAVVKTIITKNIDIDQTTLSFILKLIENE